ncbi:TonB-dependent receptor [Bacteroides sp. 214]|nr:TonB-dependent receptor [Bacteroides sp. 214]NDW12983.1 TonB-dependent receptor [Bacteroides sp. 214]
MWTATFAQSTITVSGTVQDDFETLPGVSISVKGTTTGVITDLDGKFTVNVPSDKSVLVFSYVGYVTQEITVGARRTINVTMAADDKMLDEVVVIGYGTVKKKDLTGAVSSVSASSLAAVPAMTAAQALQGKAAGVNIVTASGAPGAGAQITVRGGTSITQGTAPLYIVDGFEMSDALSNINANDIESIDILKDASSTAIYGARGSNGIVLITTKSGKKGKTSVTYNAFFSFDQISKKLDMMDNALDYTKYQYEMAVLQGKPSQYSAIFDDNTATDGADFYSGAYGRMNSRYATADVVDWQDKVFGGTALTQNHNVNITGGSETLKFLVSYNHNGQDGLLANHNQAKNTVRAKLNAELFKGVRFDFNTMFSNTDRDGGGAYSGMKNVLLQPIHGGTRFTRDELLYTQTYPELSGLDSSYDTANPIVQNNASTSNKRSRLFTVNAGIEFDFLKHFTWRTAGQYTWSNGKDTGFTDENSTSYLMDPENTGMTGYINNSESYKYQVSNTLNYAQTFASVHRVNVLLGHEVSYSESTGNKLSLKKFQYPNKGLDDISLAEVNEKSTSHSRGGMVSLFARANYSYNDRYLLTATIRTDGSSKFAKGNKWGTFPSASVAWRISEESFWKENSIDDVVNNLKLRVGYGVTGNNDIEGNRYTTSLKQTSYPMNNNTGNPAFIVDTTLGNANLQWESLKATNIGLDISLFNSRVNLTAEWYNNEIADLLMKCVLPASTGYANQFQNIGKMRNRGWEFTLNTTNIQTRNFRWTSDFNISFNTSKVVSLEKDIENKTFSVGSNRAGTLTYYAVVGEALGDMYGYKYDGLYTTDDFEDNGNGSFTLKEGVVKPANGTPQPGDMKFAADNEEGDQFTRQMVKIGNGAADFIGGFNNSFTYKGFDFSFFMKFSVGNDIYNATKHSMSPYAVYQNTQSEFGDNYYRLIDPNTGQKATTLARIKELNPNEASRTWSLGLTNSSYITYPSSYYVEDGSYLRLAQVTIGYTFPKNWLKKAMISNARIYFTGNNLLTITGYDGYDPEVTSGNDNVVCTPGYDSSTYPRSRSYVVGLNLTF